MQIFPFQDHDLSVGSLRQFYLTIDPILLKELFYVLYACPASGTDDDVIYDLSFMSEDRVYVRYQVVTTLIYRLQDLTACLDIKAVIEMLIQIYP